MSVLLAGSTSSKAPTQKNSKKQHRNHRALWTIHEMEYVETKYNVMSCAEIAQYLGRSVNAIKGMAQKLGCAPNKTADWSEAEIEILRSMYGSELAVEDINAMLPARTPVSIVLKARKLGLARPEPFWRPDELELLSAWYPVEGKKVAARLPGRSEESVKIKASKLGIKFQGHKNYRIWTDEEWALLAKNHHLPFSALCKCFPNRSEKSVEFALGKHRKGLTRQS